MDLTATSFLTLQEAADYLRHRKHTLDNMRWMGTGPAFQKHSGRIIYHAEELLLPMSSEESVTYFSRRTSWQPLSPVNDAGTSHLARNWAVHRHDSASATVRSWRYDR